MSDEADPGPPPAPPEPPAHPPLVFPGDVVQITKVGLPFFRAIIVVTNVRGWGVQGDCLTPLPNGRAIGEIPMRVRHGDFHLIGPAVVMSERMLADRRAAAQAELDRAK